MRSSPTIAPTPALPTARPCASQPAPRPAEAEPLATAEALDQRTLWPTHRIRWFLVSQSARAGGR